MSKLNDKIGEKIASEQVNIVDNPFMKEGLSSRNFDSEGVASKKTNIIQKGVLNTHLYNLKLAKKLNKNSTGHGNKSSYKSTISIAPSNLYIEPTDVDYNNMVESLDKGLIITELQGLHSGVNTVSGDFSLSAKGYFVENGKIKRAVNQITVAGNFYEMLENVEKVGSDLEFTMPSAGYIGSPTIKIKSLSIAGK